MINHLPDFIKVLVKLIYQKEFYLPHVSPYKGLTTSGKLATLAGV